MAQGFKGFHQIEMATSHFHFELKLSTPETRKFCLFVGYSEWAVRLSHKDQSAIRI